MWGSNLLFIIVVSIYIQKWKEPIFQSTWSSDHLRTGLDVAGTVHKAVIWKGLFPGGNAIDAMKQHNIYEERQDSWEKYLKGWVDLFVWLFPKTWDAPLQQDLFLV